jgi:SAM-dependent methyltransferase
MESKDHPRKASFVRRLATIPWHHLPAWAARIALLPLSRPTSSDPYHGLFRRFMADVNAMPSARLLEVGSRARSGNIYTAGFRNDVSYTGVDIQLGPNVDVVADAHELSSKFPGESFDAMFSVSVFEHLAMPWKAVLEANKVLRTGGLMFVATHPTWPPHDQPWDFYRYSKYGLSVLFNKTTGFEVLDACEGLPCRVVPLGFEKSMRTLMMSQATLGVAILARKTGPADPRLRWDVPLAEFLDTSYPTG